MGSARHIIGQLEGGSQVVVLLANGKFDLAAEGARLVGDGNAVPLVPVYGLYTYVAGKDAGQGGIPQQGRLIKLGEMNILGLPCQDQRMAKENQEQEPFTKILHSCFIGTGLPQ